MPAAIKDKAELARRLKHGTPRQRRAAAKGMRARWPEGTASANVRAGWDKIDGVIERAARTKPARDAWAKKVAARKADAKG